MQQVEHIGESRMSLRIYCLLIWKQDYTVFPVSRYHNYFVQYHSSASVFCNSTFSPMPSLWHGKMHNGSDKTKTKTSKQTNGVEEKKKKHHHQKKKKEAQSHSAALEVKKLEVKKLQVNRDVEEEKGLSWPLHALHFDIHVWKFFHSTLGDKTMAYRPWNSSRFLGFFPSFYCLVQPAFHFCKYRKANSRMLQNFKYIL